MMKTFANLCGTFIILAALPWSSARGDNQDTIYWVTDTLELVQRTFDNRTSDCPHLEIDGKVLYSRSPELLRKYTCKPFSRVMGQTGQDVMGRSTSTTLESAKKAVDSNKTSPYFKYQNATFLRGEYVDLCFDTIPFRSFPGDQCSVDHLKSSIQYFSSDTAVFMDSGGQHSIAMAAELLQARGYQPVWKLSNQLLPNAGISIHERIAVLKYYLSKFSNIPRSPSSPPVFIMDTHRNDKPFSEKRPSNASEFQLDEFPKATELKANRIGKIIWITEGSTDSAPVKITKTPSQTIQQQLKLAPEDSMRVIERYLDEGIVVYRLQIDPYDCPKSGIYRRRHSLNYDHKAIEIEYGDSVTFHESGIRYVLMKDGSFMAEDIDGYDVADKAKEQFYLKKLKKEARRNPKIKAFLKNVKLPSN